MLGHELLRISASYRRLITSIPKADRFHVFQLETEKKKGPFLGGGLPLEHGELIASAEENIFFFFLDDADVTEVH